MSLSCIADFLALADSPEAHNSLAGDFLEFNGNIISETTSIINTAKDANEALRETAESTAKVNFNITNNSAYNTYLAAATNLATAYNNSVASALETYDTALQTAETAYNTSVIPAWNQLQADYEYFGNIYAQAVDIIDNGGTVSNTYLTDGSISFTVCFVAGTPILMADGSTKPIEEIKPGDMVLAADHLNPEEKPTAAKVVRFFDNGIKPVVKLTFDNQEVTCTPEHPFYVLGHGWLPAADLTPGDACISAEGKTTTFQKRKELNEPQHVYNFEVEEKHSYYVGETSTNSILVHNVCPSCGDSNCTGPKWYWSPYRSLMTGNGFACDTLLSASHEGAGQSILENVETARSVSNSVSYIDPTPLSDSVTTFLFYAEGNDKEALSTLKWGLLGPISDLKRGSAGLRKISRFASDADGINSYKLTSEISKDVAPKTEVAAHQIAPKLESRIPITESKIDQNTLHHIFHKSRHNLDELVQLCGSEDIAYNEVYMATQNAVRARNISGIFDDISVNVRGIQITVRGNIINGNVRIGTFFREN